MFDELIVPIVCVSPLILCILVDTYCPVPAMKTLEDMEHEYRELHERGPGA